jgi:hypothetical protein
MAIEIAEVLETGPGWNRVRGTDGNIYTLQGDYNWRSNNPGNIEYGEFAINQGAIGSGAVPQGRQRGFAIFPTLSAGEEARRALQFESPSYRDLTIEQAISRYAPPNENNTRGYIDAVTRAAGVPAGTKMSELTPQQQAAFLAAQSQVEGMRQGDIFNAQGVRLPPNEIPNAVASALSVTPPRLAPNPASMSSDLAFMRNPVMSSSARMAQVTPPLPQRRPASPMDIARAPGTTVATIPTIARPGQSQIERNPRQPSAREIASAPGVTVATIPTSGVGLPPTTRVVQSVPNPMQPTAREIAEARGTTVATIPTASASQVQQAARRAALTANQSYVDRAPPSSPITPPMAMNMGSRDSVANTALGQRVAAQTAPAFNQPAGWTPTRLAPNPIVQPTNVALNQPPIQVVPNAQQQAPRRVAPIPMQASARPLAPSLVPQRVPQMAPQQGPLRIVVNGGNQVASALATQPVAQQPMTVVQALMAQGLSPSQAYDAANARARGPASLEDRVTGKGTQASSGASAYSISG